ncbi:MAG TPA: hydrogenase nickel incorporation protein HypB [Candidatus Sabulitectum sp.]|nr:hydrogenase nickel incorporation protein HypB [Candidatus Sabulitectum sp.]HPF31526.1 hydrogenase nickel incorporation protein HypB [Candidatus Sabulitectum sp.]HPJ27941.1 hydrogenase nickel incorporation protein HypB [Candidatus Sabulitectum sp.]HPR21744.1 hydrogenase nickel incorporation protein HypB [Candidatus Sabulitectum sp.]
MTARTRRVAMKSPVMKRNDDAAERNRKVFSESGLLCLNLMSSPGAGKTTLLERLAEKLGDRLAVIEGDVQTRRDAERIEKAGAYAYQIETGGSCHLDAVAVGTALNGMKPFPKTWEFLVIENVGNLICPSGFYLGEHLTAGMLSLPEGDDKVLKYPGLFSKIDLFLLNKMDLLENLRFDPDRAEEECRSLNPDVSVLRLSAETSLGIDGLVSYLEERRAEILR